MAARKKKKLWIPVTAAALAAALGAGVWLSSRSREPVNVYPFMNIGMTEFWGDNQESYGPVTTDKIQTAFLSDTQTVTEVAVKEGDTVKKGDVLFSFDTSLDGLSLERKRLEVEKVKLQIKLAGERLEETYDMVPYIPPGEPEETEPKPEDLLSEPYEVSDRVGNDKNVYDGKTKDTALICWLRDDTAVDNGIFQILSQVAEQYQEKTENDLQPEGENQATSSASGIPETQQGESPENPANPPEEQQYSININYFWNNKDPETIIWKIGKNGYTIPDVDKHLEKTYWLVSAVQKNNEGEDTPLETLTIPPYPQDAEKQSEWEQIWGKDIELRYVRSVKFEGKAVQDGQLVTITSTEPVKLKVDQDAVLVISSQIDNLEKKTEVSYSINPADGIFQTTTDGDRLFLMGTPKNPTTEPVEYTVTARYEFKDNEGNTWRVDEEYSFPVMVESQAQKGEFYVVFKVTEKNYIKGARLIWDGAKVTVYEDGTFGITPFDASSVPDHMLPPPEEDLDIELPTIDPNGIYTGEEILQMQKDLNKTIKEEKKKLKTVEAEYRIMERELGDGNVYAEIDGTVVSLLTEEEARQQKQPIVKVSGGGGFYVEGSVSELEKDHLKPGQEVTVNDWNTGGVYTGEVVSIGDFPTDNDSWNGMGNPTASYYPFVAFVDETADLQAGSYVSMNYSTSSAEQGIYLEKAFVRSEKGQHWIFVRGADGRLEKRDVRVGKVLWGSYYEILSPLGEEDFLAFPYGKHVKDGAPTVESDLSTLYGY